MDRSAFLLRYADLNRLGIEIAPYFNPTVRKSDGYNILIMDVFDTDTLRERALNDPWISNDRIAEIENVDLVGDASLIDEVVAGANLLGKVHYIASSHNLEHLPNPVRFLRGCYNALEPGGFLCMAVPDYRACFDHFRMPTRLVDWLDAFHEDRKQPSPGAIFDGMAQGCSYVVDGKPTPGCDLSQDDPAGFKSNQILIQAYEEYKARKIDQSHYQDAHCSVFFPETLELIMRDLNKLGIVEFEILEITETKGLEFFVYLRKPLAPQNVSDLEFYSYRQELMVRISNNLGASPFIKRKQLG
jgi:SAM-dependent methyltransferase